MTGEADVNTRFDLGSSNKELLAESEITPVELRSQPNLRLRVAYLLATPIEVVAAEVGSG